MRRAILSAAVVAGCAAHPQLRHATFAPLTVTVPASAVGHLSIPTTTTSSTVRVRAAGVVAAAPAERPVSGSWLALVERYPWPVATAMRVMQCESGGNANAHNPSGADGLFQVMGGPFDPAANVALAYRMWAARGWEPWVSSERCWG